MVPAPLCRKLAKDNLPRIFFCPFTTVCTTTIFCQFRISQICGCCNFNFRCWWLFLGCCGLFDGVGCAARNSAVGKAIKATVPTLFTSTGIAAKSPKWIRKGATFLRHLAADVLSHMSVIIASIFLRG